MDYKRSKWVGYAALDNTLRLSRKPDLAFEFGGYYQSKRSSAPTTSALRGASTQG